MPKTKPADDPAEGPISFKIPVNLRLWLDKEAKSRDMSRSALIRVILQRSMDRSRT